MQRCPGTRRSCFIAAALVVAIAREFIENTLLANDVAAVALTSGLAPSQPFTSNRRRLLAVVDRFRGLDTRQRLQDADDTPFGGPTKLRMLRTVERIAEWMGGADARRKSIAISGVALTSDAPVPTLVTGPGLPSALPFAPAARRVFDAGDTLAVYN